MITAAAQQILVKLSGMQWLVTVQVTAFSCQTDVSLEFKGRP